MKGFLERPSASKQSSTSYSDSESIENKSSKSTLWSGIFTSAFSFIETPSDLEKKADYGRYTGWTSTLRRVFSGCSMRRLHERVLGPSRTGMSSSNSDIWLLGLCYKVSQVDSSLDETDKTLLDAFELDLSSRILITYRKCFDAIGDTTYTSDVGWGCMLRSSQMLVAQALILHQFGRSWRKPLHKPLDKKYVEILRLFGDSITCSFSIHNLLQAGKPYGLAPGSWVGPYAICRTWKNMSLCNKPKANIVRNLLPMAIYIVSGDEDWERGGAPIVCVEDAYEHCYEFSKGRLDWTPILLLVPLVLGLEKVNPRYVPSLAATFKFPQSLGILGGKPGVSTYIVGVQDEKAFYLDPHSVQQAIHIEPHNLEVDTSSYHCNTIQHIPLYSMDPSLALGFYCRNKDDFDDFCSRASKLAEESKGAPLFTVVDNRKCIIPVGLNPNNGGHETPDDSFDIVPHVGSPVNEDDWQLL